MSKLLDILGGFDWVSPLLSLTDSGTETFVVTSAEADAAIALVTRAGIEVKYPTFSPGRFTFDVAREDGAKVRELLRGK